MLRPDWWGFRFPKILKKWEFHEKNENFIFWEEKAKRMKRWRGTLRVFPAETWLTVYRTIANTEAVAKRARVEPRTQVHVTMKILI